VEGTGEEGLMWERQEGPEGWEGRQGREEIRNKGRRRGRIGGKSRPHGHF